MVQFRIGCCNYQQQWTRNRCIARNSADHSFFNRCQQQRGNVNDNDQSSCEWPVDHSSVPDR